jgi:uncharacterized hydrophobic protein (TIGR00271 family)
MSYFLLFDSGQREVYESNFKPLLEGIIENEAPWEGKVPGNLPDNVRLLLFLSDEQIRALIPLLEGTSVILALLPHPEADQACLGWGISSNPEETANFLRESPEEIKMDVLICNGRPVFNTLVIGHAFQLTTSKRSKARGWLYRTARLFAGFSKLRPFRLQIDYGEDKSLITAASGIVVAQHKKSVLLSRLILDNSSVNDGMLHAFVLCPRSLLQLLQFGFRSIWQRNPVPAFGAHIKTDRLVFSGTENGALEFAEDGETFSSKAIELEIKKEYLKIIPGKHLEYSAEDTSSTGEIFRVNALPTGEAALALAESRLPLLKRASTEEFKELFKVLRENARPKSSYLVLMVLSTVLATFGLFGNSAPVVIGAMILAPLMSPIISLSMATLRQDRKLAIESGKTIIAGLALSFFFAVVLTLLTPLNFPNAEILSRTRPNLLDLGIAVVSGIAGAYAHAREEIAKTLAGVAIAVALVPPLAVAGIGLGWLDWSIFSGSALLLFTNLAGMILAASLTFMLLGFSPLRLATRGVVISLVIVLALTVPLGFAFKKMMNEHQLIQQLDGWKSGQTTVKEVRVQRLDPLVISLIVVSDQPLSREELEQLTQSMEARLQQPAVFEISVATRQ